MQTKEKMIDKKKQGKKNRASGAAWERKVRADLQSKGWIVCKWMNNVEFENFAEVNDEGFKFGVRIPRTGKCVPAKRKYNPFNRALSVGVGFPDFIAYKYAYNQSCGGFGDVINKSPELSGKIEYCIIFVECKTNGYLDKEEKEKARWYLDNNYCSKFLIASKVKEGRKVIVKYKELQK